jgi:hypothetical protein
VQHHRMERDGSGILGDDLLWTLRRGEVVARTVFYPLRVCSSLPAFRASDEKMHLAVNGDWIRMAADDDAGRLLLRTNSGRPIEATKLDVGASAARCRCRSVFERTPRPDVKAVATGPMATFATMTPAVAAPESRRSAAV